MECKHNTYYNDWKYGQDDDDEDYDFETFKAEMLESCDEEDTSLTNYDDLYYGRTFLSWELIKEDAKPDILKHMSDYNLPIFSAIKKG